MVETIPSRDDQQPVDGTLASRKYAIDNATKIDVSGHGTLVVSRGLKGLATVTADREDLERVEVETRGDTLKIDFKGGLILNREPKGDIRYEVVISELHELKASDGIAAHATVGDTKSFKVKASGGARVSIADVTVQSVEAEVSDGAQVTIAGVAEKHKAKVSGGAAYQADALQSHEAEIEAEDGSQATVRVRDKLKAKAKDGGVVSYIGSEVKLDVKTDNGGNVRQIANA